MALVGTLYYVPPWFYGWDTILQFSFGIITLIVALYAYKLYKISSQRELKLFSGAFFFISLSYLIWAVLNIFLIDFESNRVGVIEFNEFRLFTDAIFDLSTLGVYAYAFFFITGVLTLAYMSFKIDNPRLYIFLITLALPVIFFSYNIRLVTYLIASILFAHISLSYIKDYLSSKDGRTLIVLFAFAFLFFASLTFMYSGRAPINYAIGHLLTFVSYMLILVNFIRVLNYGQKKKQV